MPIDLSLDRLRRLVQKLPPYTRPTFHIAGTNGKGSVSAIIASILRHSSPPLSVGRFNSPHLVSVHDCIVINDESIDASVYRDTRARIERINQEIDAKLSSFELLVVTALLAFEEAKLEVVVLEVGMGGRLDATNIIPDDSVLVSALTTVDLDHQNFLGNTVVEIAKEKASIVRKGHPLVLGPQRHTGVREMVEQVVAQVGGNLVSSLSVRRRDWDDKIDGPRGPQFNISSAVGFGLPAPQPVVVDMPCFPGTVYTRLPLFGDHQIDNLGVALGAISALLSHTSCAFSGQITPETVSHGVSSVHWPGRLSFHTIPASPSHRISRPLLALADGAHNPASSETLGRYIMDLLSFITSDAPINLTYILALSHSPPKTPLQTLAPILPPKLPSHSTLTVRVNVACLTFTPPEGMPWVKSIAPMNLGQTVNTLMPDAGLWFADKGSPDQLAQALEWASTREGEGFIVIAGSLYLVADFYRFLGRVTV